MASMVDFRFLDEGMGGHVKRKREREGDDAQSAKAYEETQMAKRAATAMEGDENKPAYARPTYDGVVPGKVSGRSWKVTKTSRASSLKVKKGKPMSEDERRRQIELKKAYKERKEELKGEIKKSKQDQRKVAEDRRKKKQEDEHKGLLLQKISNPKKLSKMSKKQRKNLKIVTA
eukprot:jgi/Mesen1/9010/ME000563S08321